MTAPLNRELNRQSITPENEDAWLAMRAQDLTSTDIAALFGLSPYKTHFELWHEKKTGAVVRIADNPRMKWGRRLEATVAHGVADDMGWSIRPFKEYMRLPDLRIGASFDFRVLQIRPGAVAAVLAKNFDKGHAGNDSPDDAILEIKTVDFLAFRDGWMVEDDFIEAPAHIELQVQHQMLVSGLRRAYIGVMVGGNRIEVIERQADALVHTGIINRAEQFWQSIKDGRAPPPVMPNDAEAVIAMNQFASPGKLLDVRGDAAIASLLQDYQRLGKEAKDAEEQRLVIKADLLSRIGDAEKVITDVGSVSAGIVGPAEVAYTRAPYRNFRFTPKRVAPNAQAAE